MRDRQTEIDTESDRLTDRHTEIQRQRMIKRNRDTAETDTRID